MTSNPIQVSARRQFANSGPHLRVVSDATPIDVVAAEAAVRALLTALGQDPSSAHLRDTPRRVAGAYAEMLTPEALRDNAATRGEFFALTGVGR